MKFTTVAVLSCAVASVAAVPVKGDIAARNSVTEKFHDVKTQWKNAHAEEKTLEEKKDAIESQRNTNIKNIIFHSGKAQPAEKRDLPHPIDAAKQVWANHKEEHSMEKEHKTAEHKLEDDNDKAKWQALRHGGVDGGFSLAAGREQRSKGKNAEHQLEHNNEDMEDDLEKANWKKVTDKFWGTTAGAQAKDAAPTVAARSLDLPVEDGAIEKRGMEFRGAWTAWRQASKSEDELEEAQDKEVKDLKAKHKAAMKELKDKNWKLVKSAWSAPTQVQEQPVETTEKQQ